MTTGVLVLVAALVFAAAFGLWRAYTDGRFRGTHPIRGAARSVAEVRAQRASKPPMPARELNPPPVEPVETTAASVLHGTQWAEQLGERATLLQFSSAFCAPCRATRHVLAGVAADTPGVTHVEVDAEHNLDLVRRLGIMRTPTTIVLDSTGREVLRATGAPRRDQVTAALVTL